ncbi:hypothetical protein ACFLR1_02600, partial [Bacteroidota bacterium]
MDKATKKKDNIKYYQQLGLAKNPNKTELLRELGPVDISALKAKIAATKPEDWDTEEDFRLNANKTMTLNSVKHINFRFNEGRLYQRFNCSKWDEWKDLLLPVMDTCTEQYGYKNRFYPIVMLALLPANQSTVPHRDGSAIKVNPHKIHIPIETNDKVFFELNDDRYSFKEGYAYEVNNIIR